MAATLSAGGLGGLSARATPRRTAGAGHGGSLAAPDQGGGGGPDRGVPGRAALSADPLWHSVSQSQWRESVPAAPWGKLKTGRRRQRKASPEQHATFKKALRGHARTARREAGLCQG